MKKLFVVRVCRDAFVLAENADEAKRAQRDIEKWEDHPTVEAHPWGGVDLDGWNDLCLVYGTVRDTTLAEAKAIHAIAAKA
jgi:hypothetical protein